MQVQASQTTYVRLHASTQVITTRPPTSEAAPGTTACERCEPLPSDVRLTEIQDGSETLTYARSEKTTLRIRTQEGDIVRIRFQTRESAELGAQQSADEGEGPSTELSLAAKSSSHISIRVRGDLNEAELAAISQAVSQASVIADSFFSGDLPGAFDAASALDIDGDQLARVSLRMRLRESITYTAQGPALLPAAPGDGATGSEAIGGGEPTSNAAQLPAAAVAANVTTASAGPTSTGSAQPAEGAPVAAQQAGDTDAPPVDGSDGAAPPEQLGRPSFMAAGEALRAIGDFLTMLMDALQASEEGDAAGSVDMSLRIRIVSATIMTLSEARAADESANESPVNALVPETLDALAAMEGAHVDQVA